MREEYELQASGNKVLRKIYGTKKDEVTGTSRYKITR
jgi:hypothetical protein